MTKQLSIIIVNYGTPDLLLNFLKSAQNNADSSIVSEVVIVDNEYPNKGDSRKIIIPGSFSFKIQFVQNPKKSYASGVNRGVALAAMDTIVVANSDVELLPQFSLRPLVQKLWQDSHIGITGPQLVYPDRRWQQSYGQFPSPWRAFINLTMLDSFWYGIIMWAFRRNWLLKQPRTIHYIGGAFMVIKRDCFEEIGGFDESYIFYGEDIDFCWRARRNGWKVVFVPSVQVVHIRGASSRKVAMSKYALKLIQAGQKFVEEHFGSQQARWYGRFNRMAFYERAWLYSFVAQLTHSSRWQQRAFEVRALCNAAKKMIV